MKQLLNKFLQKPTITFFFILLSINLSYAQPPNDECFTATPLFLDNATCQASVNGTNLNATDSGVPHSCFNGTDFGGYQGGDVWFSFVAPPSGTTTIQTSDDGTGLFDTVIEIFDACNGSPVGCSDDFAGAGGFSQAILTGLIPGNTYYVAVWEYLNDDVGSFNICAWNTNDECSGAIPLPVGSGSCTSLVNGTNANATDSGVPHTCFNGVDNGGYLGGDVWFSFIAPSSGITTIETSDDGSGPFDSVIEIFDACNGSRLACNDDFAGPEGFSRITLTDLIPGNTYYVAVWEYLNQNIGSFNICAYDPILTPDECAGAIQLPVGNDICTNPVTTSNAGASSSGIPHSCPGFPIGGGGDIWFSVVAPASGQLIIQTSDSGAGRFDTVIEVYDACNGTTVACNDDFDGYEGFSEVTLAGLIPGATYYIAAWEYDSNQTITFDICAWDPNPICTTPPEPFLTINDNICPSTIGTISATGGTGTLIYYTGANAVEAANNASNDIGGSTIPPTYLPAPDIIYVCVVEEDPTGACRSNPVCGQTAPIDCCIPPADPTLTISNNVCPATTGSITTTGGSGTLYYYTGANVNEATNNANNDINGSITAPTYEAFPTIVYLCVVEDDGTGCRSNPVCGQTMPIDCCASQADPILSIIDNNCPTTIGSIEATGNNGTVYYYTGTDAAAANNNAINDIGGSLTAPAYEIFPNIVYVCVIEEDALGCRTAPVCEQTSPADCCIYPPDPVLSIINNNCPTETGTISATGGSGTLYYYTGADAAEAADNASNDIGSNTSPPAYEAFPTIVYVCVVEDDGTGCRTEPVCGQTIPTECCGAPIPVLNITNNVCPEETGNISASGSGGALTYYIGLDAATALDNAINDIEGSIFSPTYPPFPAVMHVCVVSESAGCRSAPVCGQTMPANCNCTPPADPVLEIENNTCPEPLGTISAINTTGTIYYYTGVDGLEAFNNANNNQNGSTTPPNYEAFPTAVYICIVEEDGAGCRSNVVCNQTNPVECEVCDVPDPSLDITDNVCPAEAGSISATGAGGFVYYYPAPTAEEAYDNAINNISPNFFPPTYPAFPEMLHICIVEQGSGGCRSNPVCSVTMPDCCAKPADPVLTITDNVCPTVAGTIEATGGSGTLYYYIGTSAQEASDNASLDIGGSITPPAYPPFPDTLYVCVLEDDGTGCRSNPVCGQTAPQDCCVPPAEPLLNITDNICPEETGTIEATGGMGTLYYYTGTSAQEAFENTTLDIGGSMTPPAYPASSDTLYICVVEDDDTGSGCRSNPVCGQTSPTACAPICPDDYADGTLANSKPALSGNLDAETDYEAAGTIKSTQIIGSNTATIVDYDSAIEICLDPGFEVVIGTIFSAFIDGCNGGLGGEIEPPAITNPEVEVEQRAEEDKNKQED